MDFSVSVLIKKATKLQTTTGASLRGSRTELGGGPRAARPHRLPPPTQGSCDPGGRDETPTASTEPRRGLFPSWLPQLPRAGLPSPSCPSLPPLRLLPAARLACPYEKGVITRSAATGEERLPPPKGLTDLSDTCKSSSWSVLAQAEGACVLAVLCKGDSTTTPTLICSAPILAPGTNDPQGIALPIAPQRHLLKMSFG